MGELPRVSQLLVDYLRERFGVKRAVEPAYDLAAYNMQIGQERLIQDIEQLLINQTRT